MLMTSFNVKKMLSHDQNLIVGQQLDNFKLNSVEENVSPIELEALYDLYSCTNGTGWSWNTSPDAGTIWNFSVPDPNPCYPLWQGLTCDCSSNPCLITEISLVAYNLAGQLPSSIGNLTNMSSLSLNNNELTSTVPVEIGSLVNLQSLYLNYNELTGTIPLEIGNLTSLQYLDLVSNKLIGTIPVQIGNLTNLRYLNFYDNGLTRTIPAEIGNLINLQYLYLNYNDLTGTIPVEIGSLVKLLDLYFNHNGLTGTIPMQIGNLTSLQYLDLDSNELFGTIPAQIGCLLNLQYLNLYDNGLTRAIPAEIGNLTSVQNLYLNYNDLTGSIPAEIGRLMNLQYLDLDTNKLTGTIPVEIGSLMNLLYLYLYINEFTGTIPVAICSLMNLQYLNLYDNYLNKTIPSEIGNLTSLQYLYLNYNDLTGAIPAEIGNLTNLQYLDLDSNMLTGSIPVQIGNLSSLVALSLYDNDLFWSIPVEIGSLINLQYLYLNNNVFSGTIPSEIGSLMNLLYLYLYDNELTGTIPAVIGSLTTLLELGLESNGLTGTIPMSMCNLQTFDVGTNYLQGTISECIVSSLLYYFITNDNLFSGTLPITFEDATQLETLDVSSNLFSGTLPNLDGSSVLEFMDVQQNQFRGPVRLPNSSTIQYVDISNNQFTGTLPATFFTSLVPLYSFAASTNCLTGSTPPDICSVSSLEYLDLDGLATNGACRLPIIPKIKFLTSYVLSNQIVGGIPKCLFNMPALQILHLSGNSIEWSFPDDMEVSESLVELLLSHNILTGTIPNEIQSKQWSTLDLSYNKLGGELNFAEQDLENASLVLQVNRLSGVIPSSLLNMESINILTGNMFGCDLQRNGLPVHDAAYYNYQCGSNSFNQAAVIWICFVSVMFGVGGTAWFVRFYWWRQFVQWYKKAWDSVQSYMKVYVDEPNNKRLYSFKQFVFSVRDSVVYFTAVIVLVFLPVYSVLKVYYKNVEYQYAWVASAAFVSGAPPTIVLLLFYIGFIVVLFVGLHRYANKQTEILRTNVEDEISPRNYKTYSKFFALTLVVIVNCAIMSFVNGAYVFVILSFSTQIIFAAQVSIALFKLLWNDFAVRGMMVLARKLYSLKSTREGAKDVDHSNEHIADEMPYMTFIVLFNSIIAPCLATAAVDSNCFYNVFIAPTTVNSEFPFSSSALSCNFGQFTECITTISTSVVEVSYDPPFIYSYQCTSSILTNYASVYVFMFLLVALKPVTFYALIKLYGLAPVGSCMHVVIDATLNNLLKPANLTDLRTARVLFHKERFVLRTVGKIAVFLTFGVIFPPLAVVLCVAFNSEFYLNLLTIGRFLVEIKDENIRNQFKERLSRDCEECMDLLLVPLVRLVVPFAAIFYAFFVFDIYGDAVGFKRSVWAPVLLIATPLLLWIGNTVNLVWKRRTQQRDRPVSVMKCSEMATINVVHEVSGEDKL